MPNKRKDPSNPIQIVAPNEMKDSKGQWRTHSLFWEWRRDNYTPIYTTKEEDLEIDGIVYKSLKKLYFSYNHLPGCEYDFAMEVLGSWQHWKRLENSFLRVLIAEWRDELDVRIKANAMKQIISQASHGEGSSAITAAKYLSEKGYEPKRGRPSKEEKERALKQDTALQNEIANDLERVGLKLVKGK